MELSKEPAQLLDTQEEEPKLIKRYFRQDRSGLVDLNSNTELMEFLQGLPQRQLSKRLRTFLDKWTLPVETLPIPTCEDTAA